MVSEEKNDVHLNSKNLIVVTIRGVQTKETIRDVSIAFKELSLGLLYRKKRILTIVDLRKSKRKDITKESRVAIRMYFESIPVDAVAVVGRSGLATILIFIFKTIRPNQTVQYFRHIGSGSAWLRNSSKGKKEKPVASLIPGLFSISAGILILIGWLFNNAYLTSFLPGLVPAKIITAIGLILIGLGFVRGWRAGTFKSKPIDLTSGVIAIFMLVAICIPALKPFSDVVVSSTGAEHFSIGTSVVFLLMLIVDFCANRKARWTRKLQIVAISAVLCLTYFNIFMQLYNHNFLYDYAYLFVLPINLAITFTVLCSAVILIVVYDQRGNILGNISLMGWATIFVLLYAQIATFYTFSYTTSRNNIESRQESKLQADAVNRTINNRIKVYVDALHGFKGLYSASDSVSQADFKNYFDSLDLNTNYPGLLSMTFIAAVKTKDIGTFTKEVQQDTTLYSKGNPTFAVNSLTAEPVHFIPTYTSDPSGQSGLGKDLTSIPGRLRIYPQALLSGKAYASGTVVFGASQTQRAIKGFFVTIPVKLEGASQYTGLVNANFSYDTFFNAILNSSDLANNLNISITDENQSLLYSNMAINQKATRSYGYTIPIENGSWALNVQTSSTYGLTGNQVNLPLYIVIVGQIFSALLIFVFIYQLRSRGQALQLVESATSDLEEERNNVVELHQKDEAILGSIGEGLITFDKHGHVERINSAAEKLLGWSQDEIHGKDYASALQITDMNHKSIPTSKRPIALALDEHKDVLMKVYYTHRDGHSFPADVNVAPIIVHDKVVGAIEVFRDITHDYELDKAKSEFVSLASHQLRTPLSAINWYSEMLLDGDAGSITKDQREYLTEIFQGNKRMIDLVNSLLDVSRLELGRMIGQSEPTNMADIIKSIHKEMTGQIKAKNMAMHYEVESGLKPVLGDSKQLRMIVQNLISNAVKYTNDDGTVTVTLRKASKEDIRLSGLSKESDAVFFSVKDTGFGIPIAQQKHIFEKLFRADNVRRLDVEGTGLGLYIVKQIVEKMGGRISFESVENEGTIFNILLPFTTKEIKADNQNV